MRIRTKLIFSILSVVVVVVLISIAITIVFSKKVYIWNSHVSVIDNMTDLSYDISGFVNGSQDYIASVENGEISQTSWEISREQTTFTKLKKVINIELEFTNKSNEQLRIAISGILFDTLERFSTRAVDENNLEINIEVSQNSLGGFEVILDAGENSTKTVTLIYTLEKFNMSIQGAEQDTQNLIVVVSRVL